MRARTWLVSLLVAVIFGAWATAPRVASASILNVDSASLEYRQYFLNDVPQNIWEFDIHVEGTGLAGAGVTITKPDLSTFPLTWSGNDYSTHTAYSSFSSLQGVYPAGTYGFNIGNSGQIIFNLTLTGTAPGGIATNLSPAHLSTGVPLVPAFSWNGVTTGDGDAILTNLLQPGHGQGYGEVITDTNFPGITGSVMGVTSTSWDPGVTLDPGGEYALAVSVERGSEATLTIAGDTFDTFAAYGFVNQSDFIATPEPATLSLLVLGGLLAIRRRKGK
jgi:hypothetical protein